MLINEIKDYITNKTFFNNFAKIEKRKLSVEISLPFACFTLTKAVIITKEILSIETSNFFTWVDVSQHLYTSCISASWHKLEQ